jgi:hypothetical protein
MENDIKISLCCSAIHTNCWEKALNSLRNNTVKYEVIFVGDVKPEFNLSNYPEFKYIYSKCKPSQCYQIAFLSAQGELLMWTADDASYDPNTLDNLYKMYQEENNEKLVMEVRPIEDGREITSHTFKGGETPHMAPFGVVNRKILVEQGGYDKQFICGQAENDVVMRFIEIGGVVKTCQGAIARIQHNQGHSGLSVFRGGANGNPGFYGEDRKVLEPLWITETGMRILTGVKAQDDSVDWSQFIRKTRSRPVDRYQGSLEELILKTEGPVGVW